MALTRSETPNTLGDPRAVALHGGDWLGAGPVGARAEKRLAKSVLQDWGEVA